MNNSFLHIHKKSDAATTAQSGYRSLLVGAAIAPPYTLPAFYTEATDPAEVLQLVTLKRISQTSATNYTIISETVLPNTFIEKLTSSGKTFFVSDIVTALPIPLPDTNYILEFTTDLETYQTDPYIIPAYQHKNALHDAAGNTITDTAGNVIIDDNL